jgi:hypothetical protein
MSVHLEDRFSELEKYRCRLFLNRSFIESEPEFKQVQELGRILRWVKDERDKFGTGGEQSISRHARLIDEVL